MITSLRTRIALSYVAIALVSILAISFCANLFLETRFSRYVGDRINKEKIQTIQTISGSWSAMHGWSDPELSMIGMDALEKGFILRIVDTQGMAIWDARTHNNGMCEQMITTMARNMDSRYKGWSGSYQEDAFPLLSADQRVGTVYIGYYGPFWFDDAELFFLSSLNQIVALSALIVLVLAALAGWFMAGRLSRPIRLVTDTAHQLRLGDLSARSRISSRVREIAELDLSINSLGQSLADQEDLRRRMSLDISHELRTPLTSLRGQLEAMLDGIWPADSQRLSRCRDEVLRLSRLVGQIEGLARVEAASDLALADLELSVFIKQVGANQASYFLDRDIDFSYAGTALNFRADPDKLTQILINLLSNAAKYTAPGGQVRLSAQQTHLDGQDWVAIEVTDSGCGIPEAALPHIFERFYRVDSSRSSDTGGVGIGLTIALSLARQHGGRIEASSQLGHGSAFRVFLPVRN